VGVKRSAGGVKLIGYGNRIVVNNTLDERLRLLEEQTLPEIRDTLFGQVRHSPSLSFLASADVFLLSIRHQQNENRRVSSLFSITSLDFLSY
jgi:hypothetical protein